MSNAIKPDAAPDSPGLDRLPPRGSPDPATLAASDPGLRLEPEPLKPDIPDHELLSCIGRGSYGEVWLARNVMGTWRAVKVVYRSTFENHRPFEREFQGIQRFEPISRSHPSQVGILHIGRNDDAGYFYYVMDLADDDSEALVQPETAREPVRDSRDDVPEGEAGTATSSDSTWKPKNIDPAKYRPRTLRSELKKKGQLSFDRALRISMALATALHHLHRHRLVHRDIKPANIIFINGLPKLADIGLVTGAGESRTIVGTEGYLAPEGSGTVQADIYSLGKVMYDMVFGRKGQDFPGLPPDWIELDQQAERIELNEVILRACETDPVSRYASARELLRDLELIQSGRSVKHLRWLEQQQKAFIRASVVGSLVTLLALAGWWWQKRQADIQKGLTATIQGQATDLQTRKEDLRRSLYASDMLAFQVVLENRLHRTEVPTQLFTHIPKVGESDLRGFEWRYLWGQVQNDYRRTLPIAGDYLALSPDGSTIYSGYNQVNILDRASNRVIGGFRIGSEQIHSISVSHDGRFLAVGSDRFFEQNPSGSEEGLVEVWDLARPDQPIAMLETRAPQVEFSPVNHGVVAVGVGGGQFGWRGGHALLWRTDEKESDPIVLPDCGGRISFSPDGRLLATGTRNQTIFIWDVLERQVVRTLAVHDPAIPCLKFSSNGKWLAAGLQNGDVCVWDIESEWRGPRVLNSHPLALLDIEFSADGKYLVTLTGWGEIIVTLWETSSFTVAEEMRAAGASEDIEISESSHTLISGGLKSGLREWEFASPRRKRQVHGASVGPIFSQDSRYFAIGRNEDGGSIEIRDCESMDLISSYPSDTRILGFVPHTSEVASLTRVQAGDAWCVLRWNFLEKRMEASVKLRNSADLQGPHGISPDWREAAIGDTSGIVHFWDLETGEERRKLRAHDDGVRRMMWSPNGKYFVTADYSGDVTTWNSENWAHQAAMPHFEGFITAIRFSPDSQQLFVSKWGGVESWVADSFEKVGSPPRGGYGVCAFSPDYKTICLDVEQGVTLVTAGTWKTVLLFPDKTQCASAEFSPDGRYLGTRSRLGIVTMREAPSLEEINLMSGRPGVEAYYAPVLRYAVPGLEVPGIITTWQVSGAYRRDGLRLWGIFDVEFEPETTPDEAEWRAIDSKDPILDLGELWQGTQRVAYLRTIIQAFVEAEARLELGSDDGIKVWLNSELVHANNVGRGHRFAEDVVDVRLKKGNNTLMLKVTQGTGRWVTSARLIGRDGEPLEGVTFSNKF